MLDVTCAIVRFDVPCCPAHVTKAVVGEVRVKLAIPYTQTDDAMLRRMVEFWRSLLAFV